MRLLAVIAEVVNFIALMLAISELRVTKAYLKALAATGRNGADRLAALTRRRRHSVRIFSHIVIALAAVLPWIDANSDAFALPRGWLAISFIVLSLSVGANTFFDRVDRIRIINLGGEQ